MYTKGFHRQRIYGVPNGNHVVLIRLDGYQDLTKSVTVTADNQTVYAALNQQICFSDNNFFTGSDTNRRYRIPDTDYTSTNPGDMVHSPSLHHQREHLCTWMVR